MESKSKKVQEQQPQEPVQLSKLSPKEKQQRRSNSDAAIRARKKHLAKRVMHPISLNTESEGDKEILDVISLKEFSLMGWFRFIFEEYSASEKSIMKKGEYVLPCILIEKAIENGNFDLESYLESKGKKIVKIENNNSNEEQYDYE